MLQHSSRTVSGASPSDGSVTSYSVEEVRECLLDMMKTIDHAYIVIDGPDECVGELSFNLEVLHAIQYQNAFHRSGGI